MQISTKNNKIIQSLIEWCQGRKDVRALLLTSLRTNPQAPVDLFSDNDVILAVTDIQPYFQDRSWMEAFGRVLVLYRDPIRLDHGLERFAYIIQYEDGTKIDFTLWPAELLRQIAGETELRPELDNGYAV